MSARSALLLSLLVVLLVGSSARAKEPAPLRRFALTVAANDGGPGRPRLQYAQGDARALGEVLEQLGGVDAGDAVHLVQPGARELSAAFGALGQRVREAEQRGVRTELIFYYSGHSDDTALLLGKDRVDYATLRKWLDELPAQVRIAILDSCASGAFTREKGGLRRAPFMVDVSTQVRGHAFLTSSSADEAAQESDRIGGSFFTHYLVSGLRGAADASGDRKITLTEAYRFAFDETLARTARTQYGIQHPAYEIRLAGTGDLVMTDLRSTEAELVIDESVEGRLFV
ncbi:MAG: peptidase caspase catalytic subunit p20, partial [Myxococcaceae bacterium]|nr:peptidase caspase catalytic subunit p20 [Myxococcaceae bacterium]